jgi:HEPN domain-containing protein
MDDARYARAGKRFNLACFLSQQAVDKAIKGYLYAHGRALVLGLSVASLCQDVTAFDANLEKLRQQAAPLDKYYIPTRYPNGLPGGIPSEAFDQVDADRALELAQYAIQFIEDHFPSATSVSDEPGGEHNG